MGFTRRSFLGSALIGIASVAAAGRPVSARAVPLPRVSAGLSPLLREQALAALERHRASIVNRDVMAIADFSQPSRAPRLHLLRLADGSVRSHLVAHGRGSDPSHTGWLERFSNEPRSFATSAGAYRTDSAYIGTHGRSIRLAGLDPSNSNAATRAIVVHGAWYVSDDMVAHTGMLGRSEGCLAVSAASLDEVLACLGPGRLIYAGRA